MSGVEPPSLRCSVVAAQTNKCRVHRGKRYENPEVEDKSKVWGELNPSSGRGTVLTVASAWV